MEEKATLEDFERAFAKMKAAGYTPRNAAGWLSYLRKRGVSSEDLETIVDILCKLHKPKSASTAANPVAQQQNQGQPCEAFG